MTAARRIINYARLGFSPNYHNLAIFDNIADTEAKKAMNSTL